MSNILVISTSLRAKSNSDILTERLIAGAKDAGHEVEHISLKGKDLKNGEYKLGGGVVDPLPEDAPFFVKDY